MFKLLPFALCSFLALSACGDSTPPPRDLADLPAARSSWAIAVATTSRGPEIFGMFGLGAGKSSVDISNDIYAYSVRDNSWRTVGKFPVEPGRLAPSAAQLGRAIYVSGGFSLAEDGSEATQMGGFALDPETGVVVPDSVLGFWVDDTVTAPWQDRYAIAFGGWADRRTSSNVQVYDTQTRMFEMSDELPLAVFGHAGAMLDGRVVLCDGVTAQPDEKGQLQFQLSDKCFLGIASGLPLRIKWEPIPSHPGKPLYRMAAGATRQHGARIVFAGGAEQLYRFDGVSSDGKPLKLSDRVFSFDLDRREWHVHRALPVAITDVRQLAEVNNEFFVLGGMREDGLVSQRAFAFSLSKPEKPQ